MASKPATRPSVRERLSNHPCPNCGKDRSEWGPAPKRGPGRTFCSKACKIEMNNRLTVEARAVIGYLKAWRIDRGQGEIAQRSFSAVCEIVDLFNAEDLAADRPRADLYAATLISGNTFDRYADRRHVKVACTRGFQGCEGVHRAGTRCPDLNTAKRLARSAGWQTDGDEVICPNCQDTTLERRIAE